MILSCEFSSYISTLQVLILAYTIIMISNSMSQAVLAKAQDNFPAVYSMEKDIIVEFFAFVYYLTYTKRERYVSSIK